MAEPFHAFIQNLTVATTHGAAVVSLPRSQVEIADWDMQWQDRITKVIRRVAKDLIANDEAEISEVVRRRLFGDAGPERHRKRVSKAYADWCFERRAQLPPEWTAVDSAATEARARESLRVGLSICPCVCPCWLELHDPQGVQAAGGDRLPHRRGLAARGAGEVDPARASFATLHLWWARRPLASSRAVLMALLLPDPCGPHCPEAFRREARRILPKFVADFAHHPSGLPAAEEDGVRWVLRRVGTTGRSAP